MADLSDSTPAQLLKAYIVAGGRSSLFTGWSFKTGKLPADPDQVIAMIDQGGPSTFPHLLVDYPGVQFLVRSSQGGDGYNTSYLVMRQIRDIVLGMDGHPTEFSELDGVTERGGILPLGYDDKDRHVWSYNVQLLVEPEANALTNRESI